MKVRAVGNFSAGAAPRKRAARHQAKLKEFALTLKPKRATSVLYYPEAAVFYYDLGSRLGSNDGLGDFA